jgi:hypothetical protein
MAPATPDGNITLSDDMATISLSESQTKRERTYKLDTIRSSLRMKKQDNWSFELLKEPKRN